MLTIVCWMNNGAEGYPLEMRVFGTFDNQEEVDDFIEINYDCVNQYDEYRILRCEKSS